MAGQDGILWLIFLAALVIIGAFFFFQMRKQLIKAIPVTIICCLVALGVMLLKYIQIQSSLRTDFGSLGIYFSIDIGAIGTILGFIVALVGTAFLKQSDLTEKLDTSKFCPQCGAKNEPCNQFCKECGVKLG